MTAKQLYELTAPLFAKHPSACPPRFYCQQGNYRSGFFGWRDRNDWTGTGLCDEDSDIAALIIQGHLVEWLAKNGEAPECTQFSDEWIVYMNRKNASGETLLHALIAACMEIEQ